MKIYYMLSADLLDKLARDRYGLVWFQGGLLANLSECKRICHSTEVANTEVHATIYGVSQAKFLTAVKRISKIILGGTLSKMSLSEYEYKLGEIATIISNQCSVVTVRCEEGDIKK